MLFDCQNVTNLRQNLLLRFSDLMSVLVSFESQERFRFDFKVCFATDVFMDRFRVALIKEQGAECILVPQLWQQLSQVLTCQTNLDQSVPQGHEFS